MATIHTREGSVLFELMQIHGMRTSDDELRTYREYLSLLVPFFIYSREFINAYNKEVSNMYEPQSNSLIPKDTHGQTFWKQLQFVNVAYTTYFLFGIMRGYPAFLFDQLKAPTSAIKIDSTSAESCIASLNIFANPVGSILAGFLMDKIGRKLMLQLSMSLFVLGWATVTCATNLISLYAGNIVVGLAIGMGACSTTYVAEICDVKNRCMLLSFLEIHYSLGILIAYISTNYMKWNLAALMFTLFSIVSLVLLQWIPESPLWLIKQGRIKDAFVAFKRTHPQEDEDDETNAEFKILRETTSEDLQTTRTFAAIKENAKPFVILILFHVLLQGTGYNILLTYLTKFLNGMQLPEFAVEKVGIGYSVAAFVASFLTPVTVNYWPRRTATMVSGLGMAIPLAVMGVYGTFLHVPGTELYGYWFIVPLNLYLFLMFCTIGVLTLSQSMIGELYPIEVRGVMCGLTEAIGTVLSGVTVFVYPNLQQYCSIPTLFYVFAFFGVLTILYGYYILPETYGKSLNEIQTEYFRPKTLSCSSNEDRPRQVPV